MADDCCNSGDGLCTPPPLASSERQKGKPPRCAIRFQYVWREAKNKE